MKKLLFVLIMLIAGHTVWSQNQILTSISPKVSLFPSTGLSYMDDPARFFNIQMINTTGVSMDIFFTIELTADFTATNQNYYVRTKKEIQPVAPLTVGAVPVLVNRAVFDQIIGHLNPAAYETNYDRNKLMRDLLALPEGQYRFCITPYLWDGYNNPNPLQVGEQVCYTFTICYTGSAPEFTTPVNGFSAANLNNSNPLNNMLNPLLMSNHVITPSFEHGHIFSSDIREFSQYTHLPLSRQVVFNWTGVISNCLTSNDFDYIFKIVEITGNQNVQEAINNSATLTTFNNRSNTVYIHDTIANRHFQLKRGHVYAAQVQAVLKKNLMTEIQLSNDGKSQIITFVWGENSPIALFGPGVASPSSSVSDNHNDVIATIEKPYFLSPGVDKSSQTNNRPNVSPTTFPIPFSANNPYITDVEPGDMPYYQVPVSDTLDVRWMPVLGDSVLKVIYTTELYEYAGGDIHNSMIGLPLQSSTTTDIKSDNTGLKLVSIMSTPTDSWTTSLREGYKYLLHLKAETFYSYEKQTSITVTNYLHSTPRNHDTVATSIGYGSTDLYSDIVFSWGTDTNALDQVYPPQFTYPQDLSTKQWDDTLMFDIPEVSKYEEFKFKWKPASGVNYGDSVYYKLLIAELPKGKTPQQVKDTFYLKDSLTCTSYMDTVLFDSLKIGGQYMAVLWTYIKQTEDQSDHYNLVNNGKSIYTTFKLVEPRAYNADLNNKIKCSPNALDNLSKEIITPKADSLVQNKVQLMMGEFPLVMQEVQFDQEKKRYSGDGYVIWHPFGIDVPLKVKFDTIQINKDFQIINGTAVSTATDSSTYLSALMNDLNLSDWSADDINRIASQFGEISEVKAYYDKFQEYQKYAEKYGKKYGGIAGPVFGSGNTPSTEVLTFPLCLTDETLTNSKNVIYSINNMFFSPLTALMNIWAIFAAQEEDYYVPFLANNICMDQRHFYGKPDQHIDLFMARTYEKELNDGYVLRFKASSNFADPKDGTFITIDTGALKCIHAEMQLELNSNDFRGLDKDGNPVKGQPVKASMIAEFKDWDDWVVKVNMDPFAVAGADRFLFYPTGKGIFYDHSEKQTPSEVSLTYEYLYGTPPPPNMKEEEKKKLTKATNEWTGFYWDDLKVFLSDEISNTFSDTVDRKDSMVVYQYGLNNTLTDSVHYCYPGSRINFGAHGLIIDKFGFSTDLYAHDIIDANTTEGWGWAFSLDTIRLRFTKNQYKAGVIKGGMGVPLFKGGFDYECSIGADSLTFNLQSRRDTMPLDLWAADVNFVKESSYFRIKKIYKESGTRVDLTLNGFISLKTSKIGLPTDFEAVKFEHMGMRNYNLGGTPKAGTASIQKFEFDIGEWSFASPQKYIGGYSPDHVAEMEDNTSEVSFFGFTFSLEKIDPIVDYLGDNLKLGVKMVGKMKFATEGTDLGATTGFSVWGVTEPKNKFHVKEVKGKLDSIVLDNIDFEVFKLSGSLGFTYECPTCTKVTGFAGKLNVTIMSEVTLAMSAGFGKERDNRGEYSWWFFDGACKFPGGIPLGAVSINGFAGGFAYNMKSTKNLASFTTKNLLEKAEGNTNENAIKSSGMDFTPARDCWVANAGISLILTGAKNTMNADGLVSLRISNKHFSGVFIDANAYVLTSMDENVTPGDSKNNKSPLIRARAIMGFETYDTYDYFRLSINIKAEINLDNLLKGVSSTVLGNQLGTAIHSGTSLATNSNINSQLDNLENNSELSSHGETDRNRAANASDAAGSHVSFNSEASIPIDFELKHYKKNYQGHKKGTTDWYFAIGKPKYEDRVQLSATLNMVIVRAFAEFTFYMQTGNAFAYEMPPLSDDLQKFFGIAGGGKKLDANSRDVKKSRMIDNSDWLKIDKGGGFCLGSTFHTEVDLNFFLYVDVTADLGFDVALLDVGGMGCPGHNQIGKHNFYALGRVYGALQGDVGLRLNLGFWDGKFSLFSAGVGALLQGGGPNPSYCYGLLRFKVSLLGGLLKFSTSADFQLGDVCVPGAGDPLANVKLFQNVTPGYTSETEANRTSNLQSPLQIGTIVSNMPWDRDVLLCDQDGKNPRRFCFVLIEDNCKMATKSGSQFVNSTGSEMLKFTPSNSDDNVYLFETEAGGFIPNTVNRIKLQARCFERRKSLQGKSQLLRVENEKKKDVKYDVNTGTASTTYNTESYDWYDPTFLDNKTGKTIVRPFKKDTVMYFKTRSLGENLDDGVVFSWPYNGDPFFWTEEYVHAPNSDVPFCRMYLFTRYDNLFDKDKLSEQGKQLKVYLLKNGLEDGEIAECRYSYVTNGSLPYVDVQLPKKEFVSQTGKGAHLLQFLIVDKNAYESALSAAQQAANITVKKSEYQSRISDKTYAEAEAAHNRKTGNGGASSVLTYHGTGNANFSGVSFASLGLAGSSHNTSGTAYLAGSSVSSLLGNMMQHYQDMTGHGQMPSVDMSQFSGAGILESLYSSNNSINIQDEMLDEIYEDKHTVGKDSMTYYRTMLKEGYRISSSIGKQIYRWTWFASGSTIEKTLTSRVFGEGAASIYDNDIASSINKASVTDNDSYFTLSDFHSSYNSSLDLYAWMFLPYDPEDVTRYHTGCKMPPICYLALDRNSGTLMELHRQYFQHFIDLERDFKQTPLLTTFHCRKKKSSIRYDANTVMASGYLASEFQRILSGGLYINNNRKLSTIDRRIKGGTDFTQCVAKNYHPNTVDVPCILDFRVRNDQSRQPLDDKYFETAYSNKQPYLKYDDGKYSWDWRIDDYATVSIIKDLNKLAWFMYDNQLHAQSLNKRDWSGKMKLFNLYYNANNINAFLTYTNFPYDMPMIYRVVHYMWALDDLRPDTYYAATDGHSYKLLDLEKEYIDVNLLQLRDRLWAKYWFSAKGQCLDIGGHGFDRDFYYYNSSTLYYPVTCDQGYDKHHKCSAHQTSVLGNWYVPFDGSYYNVYNPPRPTYKMNVKLYFMTTRAENFNSNMMKIAVAIKNSSAQSTRVFYPNKILNTAGRDMSYTIKLNSGGGLSGTLCNWLIDPYNRLNNFRPSDTYGDD